MFRLVLVIAVGGISHLAAADLSGRWTGTLETDGSRVPVYLSDAAKEIRDDRGAPRNPGLGVPYTTRQIFETSDMIPPISEEPRTLKRPDGIDTQLENHINHGQFENVMLDNVDRSDFPDASPLEVNVMGVHEMHNGAEAELHPGKSRPALRPHGTRRGDASSTHNRHPL